jgi:hypothetical protein
VATPLSLRLPRESDALCGLCGWWLRQWQRFPSRGRNAAALHGVVDYDESRAVAEAAAWRTALLIELRLRLPEIAKIGPDARPAARETTVELGVSPRLLSISVVGC